MSAAYAHHFLFGLGVGLSCTPLLCLLTASIVHSRMLKRIQAETAKRSEREKRLEETLEPDEDADDTERGEHDTADAEPWLASPENHQDQRRWAAGVHDDRELVNEDKDNAEGL